MFALTHTHNTHTHTHTHTGLCLLAGALQPLAGRTVLQGWEPRPRTRAHCAHNIARALRVLALQAKLQVMQADMGGQGVRRLRGADLASPLCHEAILAGDVDVVLALLRLVRAAYQRG